MTLVARRVTEPLEELIEEVTRTRPKHEERKTLGRLLQKPAARSSTDASIAKTKKRILHHSELASPPSTGRDPLYTPRNSNTRKRKVDER